MKQFWRHNGLTLVLLALFAATLGVGRFATGLRQYNEEREARGLARVAAGAFAVSPHFIETTMENWESEFFQMFVFIVITAFLFQKGSAQSNDPHKPGARGPPPITVGEYLQGSRFWFESFQNWQRESLAVAAMVWRSVCLREHGSVESKPVNMAHEDQE